MAGQDPTTSWKKATELSPRDTRILIPAGIRAETMGDLRTAETYLRQAERYNKLWLPRWTLANFYARRGGQVQTFSWLRAALERSYGETQAAFQLAVDTGASESVIASRVLPNSAHPIGQFFYFVARKAIAAGELPLLESMAVKFVGLAAQDHRGFVQGYPLVALIDRLLLDQFGEVAARLWDLGCHSGLIDSLPREKAGLVVNGSFRHPFLGHGLDWSLFTPPGISAVQHRGPGTVKISFSGLQQGTSRLLSQTLAIPAHQAWRVSFEFGTQSINSRRPAFAWMLGDEVLPLADPIVGEGWAVNSFLIPAADSRRTTPLSLVVRELPGMVRPEGELWIRNVQGAVAK
ncbi:MAG: hypothetical protein NTV70_01955 [Acidobacteria bacterium]|nr:hypothetical protein [Acidobacteriota bacterium]